jgi:hypothetical protein
MSQQKINFNAANTSLNSNLETAHQVAKVLGLLAFTNPRIFGEPAPGAPGIGVNLIPEVIKKGDTENPKFNGTGDRRDVDITQTMSDLGFGAGDTGNLSVTVDESNDFFNVAQIWTKLQDTSMAMTTKLVALIDDTLGVNDGNGQGRVLTLVNSASGVSDSIRELVLGE